MKDNEFKILTLIQYQIFFLGSSTELIMMLLVF